MTPHADDGNPKGAESAWRSTGLSIQDWNPALMWWRKLSPDGRNCDQVTSQTLTDMGGGATFYDFLVEVERVQIVCRCTGSTRYGPSGKGFPVVIPAMPQALHIAASSEKGVST
jgi:hypothetical protein